MYTTRHLKSANAYHLGILSENIISFLKQQYILNISKQLVRLFTGALKANCWVAKAYRIIYGSDEMLVNARRGKVLGKHFPFNNGMTVFLKYIINKLSFGPKKQDFCNVVTRFQGFYLIFWNGGARGLRSSQKWVSKLWNFAYLEST